jgi:hypothetical protein
MYLTEEIKNIELFMKELDKIENSKLIEKLSKFKLNKDIKWISVGKNKRGYGWKVNFELDIPDELITNKKAFTKLQEDIYDLVYEFLDKFEGYVNKYPMVDSEKGKVIYKERLVYPYKDMIMIQTLFGADNIPDFLENVYPAMKRLADEATANLDEKSFEFEIDGTVYKVADVYQIYESLFAPMVYEMYFFAGLDDLYKKFKSMFSEYLKKMQDVVDRYKEEYGIKDDEEDEDEYSYSYSKPKKFKRRR